MPLVTVDELVTQSRQRADMVNSNFVKPSEWITYVNKGYTDLYDLLTSKYEDYYTISSTFTIPSGSNSYALPANFYKVRGVDRSTGGGNYYPLKIFNFEDRNRSGFYGRYRGIEPYVKYRIMGNNLIFTPDDQASGDYRLWYVPTAVPLTTGSQEIDTVNGWEDYITVTAAIMALMKEESDVSALAMELQMIEKRIENMAANRNAGLAERVTDVTSAGFYDPFFYR